MTVGFAALKARRWSDCGRRDLYIKIAALSRDETPVGTGVVKHAESDGNLRAGLMLRQTIPDGMWPVCGAGGPSIGLWWTNIHRRLSVETIREGINSRIPLIRIRFGRERQPPRVLRF